MSGDGCALWLHFSNLGGHHFYFYFSFSLNFTFHDGLRAGTARDGGLAETKSDTMELVEVTISKIGVPLGKVVDRLRHPDFLVVGGRLEYAATVDVAEELVTSPVQELVICHVHLPVYAARSTVTSGPNVYCSDN